MNATAKHVLCYGDSNTWGYIPGSGGRRMAADVRWPGVAAKALGEGFRITEEGLCGRTTIWDDPFTPGIQRNGFKTFGAVLDTHKPLDAVIIFLGTNDLKLHFSVTPDGVAKGAENLILAARTSAFGPGNGRPPAVLVICPCPMIEVEGAAFGDIYAGGREKSLGLRRAFGRLGARTGTPVLYAEDFVSSDRADGIHLSPESHGVLGQEVAKWVGETFKRQA